MDDVQTYRRELGKRIAIVIGKYKTKSAACEVAEISYEQINKWIAGTVKVPVDALYRLASGVDVDFCWICTGENRNANVLPLHAEQPRIRLDIDVLRDVLTAVASAARDQGICFDPSRFPDLVFALHDYLLEARRRDAGAVIDLTAMSNIIKLAGRS